MVDTIGTSLHPTTARRSSNEEDAQEFQDDLTSGTFFFERGQGRVAAAAADAAAENVTPGGVKAGGRGAASGSGRSRTAETSTVVDTMRTDASAESSTHRAASELPTATAGGSLSLPTGTDT